MATRIRVAVGIAAVAGMLAAAVGITAVCWSVRWQFGLIAAGILAAGLGRSAYSTLSEWVEPS